MSSELKYGAAGEGLRGSGGCTESGQESWPREKALCPAFTREDFSVSLHLMLNTEGRWGHKHGHMCVTQRTDDFGRHTPESTITEAAFQEHLLSTSYFRFYFRGLESKQKIILFSPKIRVLGFQYFLILDLFWIP